MGIRFVSSTHGYGPIQMNVWGVMIRNKCYLILGRPFEWLSYLAYYYLFPSSSIHIYTSGRGRTLFNSSPLFISVCHIFPIISLLLLWNIDSYKLKTTQAVNMLFPRLVLLISALVVGVDAVVNETDVTARLPSCAVSHIASLYWLRSILIKIQRSNVLLESCLRLQ